MKFIAQMYINSSRIVLLAARPVTRQPTALVILLRAAAGDTLVVSQDAGQLVEKPKV